MIRVIEKKPIELEEYWLVRVIRDTLTKKEVIKEVKFETYPTDQDIVEILQNVSSNCFASVCHNFRLIE